MRLPQRKVINLDEYVVLIEYDGKGKLEISVLDELGDEIEGLYISDCTDCDDKPDEDENITFNPN